MAEAAHVMSLEPVSIQLRYLQTLTEIGAEKNSTIVFPLPMDLISDLGELLKKTSENGKPKALAATPRP